MDDKKLAGKVAVITGGARGLGRGYALRLADLGCDIAVIDRNLKGYEVYEFEKKQMTAPTAADECRALGVRAMGLECDVSDRETTEKAIDEIVRAMGRIDIAICNAGGSVYKFADEIDPDETIPAPLFGREEEDKDKGPPDISSIGTPSDCPQEMLTRVLNNNLMATLYLCMAVAPHMKKQKSGKIVNVASAAGFSARGNTMHPYGMAKAAIIYYTRALAQELAPYSINVNCVAPGINRTGRPGDRSASADRIPLRREGTIEDCAKVVEFLVTDMSDYVTGRTILTDGGVID